MAQPIKSGGSYGDSSTDVGKNRKLSDLRGMLATQVDQIADTDPNGGNVSSPVEAPPPAPAADPVDDSTDERAEPRRKRGFDYGTPILPPPEIPPATPEEKGEQPKEAPPATPAATPAPADDNDPADLSDYTPEEVNGFKKFNKGEVPKTKAELRAARKAFGEDYWRTQTRMAEIAKTGGPTPAPATEPAATTQPAAKPSDPVAAPVGPTDDPLAALPDLPELKPFKQALQGQYKDVEKAIATVEYWEGEAARLDDLTPAVKQKFAAGEITEADYLKHAEAALRAHQQAKGWEKEGRKRVEGFNLEFSRAKSVADLANLRQGIEAREKKETDSRQEADAASYNAAWQTAMETAAKDLALSTDEDKKEFGEYVLGLALGRQSIEGKLPDPATFVSSVVAKEKAKLAKIRGAGATDYAKDKADDAPKAPPTSPRTPAQNVQPKAGKKSIEALRREIMKAELPH
jgi:hypothetical protein